MPYHIPHRYLKQISLQAYLLAHLHHSNPFDWDDLAPALLSLYVECPCITLRKCCKVHCCSNKTSEETFHEVALPFDNENRNALNLHYYTSYYRFKNPTANVITSRVSPFLTAYHYVYSLTTTSFDFKR